VQNRKGYINVQHLLFDNKHSLSLKLGIDMT